MEEVILFLLTFLLVLVIYELFIVRKYRRNDIDKKENEKDPFEILYLVKRYNLDMRKVSYNQLLQLVALVSSFDIALIVSIITRFESFLLILLVGIILTFIVIIVSYHFIYLFYKKKGMIKNGKHK
ncbi:MAG: hypothetical protein IJJ63_03930 [Bacilli bacterium]|nr:hypothetical protein [Bacilli bacterium]